MVAGFEKRCFQAFSSGAYRGNNAARRAAVNDYIERLRRSERQERRGEDQSNRFHYHNSFSASWMLRGLLSCTLMMPKDALPTEAFGPLKITWFRALKASARS